MITIAQESFNLEVGAEILPLAQAGWDESTDIKGPTCAYFGERAFLIEPDVERYQELNQRGLLVFMALRNDSVLKGYILGLTYWSLHHRRILCGIADTAYVDPAYRAYTTVIAEKFEAAMRKLNVEIIGWPTHADGPVYEVLKARGYVEDDVVMEKRLCASH
jgi:hypothetical protein